MVGMKLLIVDDEHETRDGLLRIVSQMGYEFSTIITAQDGYVALEMTENFIPDILLCDIRMPRMDGLELAAALLKKNEDIRVIFISGYADKEYLKTAVALKADCYIEKPIDIDELTDAMKKSVSLLQKRKTEKNEKERLADIADIYSRNQLLKSLLSSSNFIKSVKTKIAGSYENWPDKGFHTSYVFHLNWKKELEPQTKDINIQQLLVHIEKEISKSIYKDVVKENVLCGVVSQELIGAVVETSEFNWHIIKPELEKFVMLLPSRLRSLLSIRIVVSRKAIGLEDISKAFREARDIAYWIVFTENENKIVYCSDEFESIPLKDKCAQFEMNLKNLNIFQAKQLVYEQKRDITSKVSGDVKKAREYYKKLLQICMNSEVVSRNYTENERQILSSFSDLRSLKQMSNFLINRIDDMYPKMTIPSDVSSKVSSAIQYIWEKIDDPMLSINSIADELHLSKNYLNSVYKNETGRSLHKSIIEIRVECAKHLLLQDFALNDVSRRVGFTDSSYFSTVFKKQTGISPTKYRHDKSPSANKDGME